jgi:hypothetical protein
LAWFYFSLLPNSELSVFLIFGANLSQQGSFLNQPAARPLLNSTSRPFSERKLPRRRINCLSTPTYPCTRAVILERWVSIKPEAILHPFSTSGKGQRSHQLTPARSAGSPRLRGLSRAAFCILLLISVPEILAPLTIGVALRYRVANRTASIATSNLEAPSFLTVPTAVTVGICGRLLSYLMRRRTTR